MNVPSLHFHCLHFRQLALKELYDLLQLRQEVFVVEQDCPYLDADGKDQASYHLLGYDKKEQLQAYTRLVPRGVSYPDYASIGRVITSQHIRRTGMGKLLMQESIKWAAGLFPDTPLKISAQCYLIDFYQGLGFKPVGEEYLEDDIPHIGMVKQVV